jgi:acetyl esterase/lipase
MDLYYPLDATSDAGLPVVVLVIGYADVGVEPMPGFGCKLKEMAWAISWSQSIAAWGMAAITYSSRQPATDVDALLRYVREHAAALRIDENRIGLWACSGHVPTALSVLLRKDPGESLRCAVLCCGLTLDFEGSTVVADAAKTYGFVNPCAGKSADDLPRDVALFVARAGREQFPGLNDALDRFVASALTRNVPLTVVNHAEGPHGFDIFEDSEISRAIIKQILAFLRFQLGRA